MPPVIQRILRRFEVMRLYGDPPPSTFYDRIKNGHIPAPDFELGPQTPGWTEGLIARHQAARITRDHRLAEPTENDEPEKT
jgi:predicted DNA-binding transcriptional regulator AlpA